MRGSWSPRRSGGYEPAGWVSAGSNKRRAWIERYRQLWAARFDELDKVVEELKQKEKANGRKK